MPAASILTKEPRVIFTHEKWTVRELILDWTKINKLWADMQAYKTLFSDLTRGDYNNFLQLLTQSNTIWFEVLEDDKNVGVMWLSELELLTDAKAHMVFFDRKPHEKLEVVRGTLRWCFANIPLQRITAELPVIYHATIRLVKKAGFQYEGTRRKAVLIGGWKDMSLFGILREEIS